MEIPQNAQQIAREAEQVTEAVYYEAARVYQEVEQARDSAWCASEDALRLQKAVAQEVAACQEAERAASSARRATGDAVKLQKQLAREAEKIAREAEQIVQEAEQAAPTA